MASHGVVSTGVPTPESFGFDNPETTPLSIPTNPATPPPASRIVVNHTNGRRPLARFSSRDGGCTVTEKYMIAGTDTKVKDALDHVRTDTQELFRAISDSVARRGGATKADLETFAQKAKAVTESVKGSMTT